MIKCHPDHAQAIAQRAQKLGLATIGQAHGLLVVQGNAAAGAKAPARVRSILSTTRSWQGVELAELDLPRYLHRPLSSSAAGSVSQGLTPPVDCSERDTPLAATGTTLPEVQPYGLEMIQATSPQLPNSTDKAGVVVCIIDSGLDSGHPDLNSNTIDGCKYQDAFAPAGCPFYWGQDYVGHGTHVAGTIAAPKNGLGVIGVIPGKSEVYVVRVFNDTGDVNQGQGLVYGSTVVLAYTQCEGRLAAMQDAYPDRQYRMVVSLSLGAPGPLTIEQLYFREAVKRGDILFVASSGNNGSAATLIGGQLSSSINPGNYPGAYPEVISVAAVDCTKRLGPFSQKNPSVDLAAPGVDILSTAPRDLPIRSGAMMGGFKSRNPKISIKGFGTPNTNQVRFSGKGMVTGKVVDCGSGTSPCPAAKDSICLVQYDPQLKPIPPQGTKPSQNPSKNPVKPAGNSSRSARTGSGAQWFSQSLQNAQNAGGGLDDDLSEPQLQPSRFFCDLMEFCMKQGAKAVLIGAPAMATGFYGKVPDLPLYPGGPTPAGIISEAPVYADLNCEECGCWQRIKKAARLPAAGLNLKQYAEVKQAAAAAATAGAGGSSQGFVGTVESKVDAYQRLSGTSMAVPHVTGAIARVWAAYPNCKAQTIRTAFEQTAEDLGPKGKDVQYGYGLVQAEAAFEYLARQPCAQGLQEPGQDQADQSTGQGQADN